MAMTSMKMKKADMDTDMPQAASGDSPQYPYGLTLHLDAMCMEKLGMKEPPAVGTKLMLHAMVEVTSVSQYKSKDATDGSVALQITDMELEGKSSAAEKLYGKK